MKIKNLRRKGTFLAVVAIAAVLSSCNRGYGCPSNFSMDDVLSTVVNAVISCF
ncbi:MAG: hypothetical protein KDC66_17805 [Phaeodactylibacter sp.]|nr:hypothetical protein [Phaeodactylibacter sp.]MCB9276009.1 hypothetical protein [Lewinellaceae bacterium]